MTRDEQKGIHEQSKSLMIRAKGMLPILCYAVCGIALGYAVTFAKAKYHAHEHAAAFAAHNVHAGEFAKLVSSFGQGRPIMVTLKDCSHCEDARNWMKPRGIQVTEIPYGSNEAVAAVRTKYHANGTPTLITNSELVYGFEPHAWSAALVQ